MTVFTERAAIQQRITEIREERRELSIEHSDLLDRLHILDANETEAVDLDSVLGSMTHALETLKGLIPHIPAEALIRQVAEYVESNEITLSIDEGEVKPELAPGHVISGQMYKDSEKHLEEKPSTPRPKKKNRLEQAAEEEMVIIEVLKEKGVPTKQIDLKKAVEDILEYEILAPTFHNKVSNLMLKDSRLQKPMRGFYQYIV